MPPRHYFLSGSVWKTTICVERLNSCFLCGSQCRKSLGVLSFSNSSRYNPDLKSNVGGFSQLAGTGPGVAVLCALCSKTKEYRIRRILICISQIQVIKLSCGGSCWLTTTLYVLKLRKWFLHAAKKSLKTRLRTKIVDNNCTSAVCCLTRRQLIWVEKEITVQLLTEYVSYYPSAMI